MWSRVLEQRKIWTIRKSNLIIEYNIKKINKVEDSQGFYWKIEGRKLTIWTRKLKVEVGKYKIKWRNVKISWREIKNNWPVFLNGNFGK